MSFQPPAPKKSSASLWLSGAVILLVALIMAVVLLLNRQPAPSAPAAAVIVSAGTATPELAAAASTDAATPTPVSTETPTSTPLPQLGTSNLFIEYILDASGSMRETLSDGSPKIEVAQRVLTEHMRSFRPETNIGLRAYGHRLPYQQTAESCRDIELIAPPQKGQMERIASWLQDFTVQGMTPLAASLELARDDFIYDAARINAIVMLSDGIETCGGDPCRLVEDLKAEGINFTIHVIGLDVDDPTRQQLSCIAKAGGGTYHDARSQQELNAALGAVQADVTQDEVIVPPGVNTPTPAPPTATPTLPVDPTGTDRVAFFSSRNHRDHQDIGPDGRKPDDIFVIYLDSREEQYVAQPNASFGGASLTWRPDGRVLITESSMSSKLYVVNADARDDVRLLSGPLMDPVAMNITWSPDGTRAALTCWDTQRRSGGNEEICLLGADLDPAGLIRLTDNEDWDWMPAWSPDGNRIAFSSGYPGERLMDVFIMDLANPGTPLRQITFGVYSRDVNWSPDGHWIAFISYNPDPSTGMWSLNIVPADGSRSPVLIGSSFNLPVWSPDGSVLAFDRMTAPDKYAGVYLANGDGSNARLVAPNAGHPSWSPDGTRLAFEREGNIWIMDSDGQNQQQLTGSGFDHSPAWSPDTP